MTETRKKIHKRRNRLTQRKKKRTQRKTELTENAKTNNDTGVSETSQPPAQVQQEFPTVQQRESDSEKKRIYERDLYASLSPGKKKKLAARTNARRDATVLSGFASLPHSGNECQSEREGDDGIVMLEGKREEPKKIAYSGSWLCRKTDDVFMGKMEVERDFRGHLFDLQTGEGTVTCEHCFAAKFPGESETKCCGKGSIILQSIENDSRLFKDLFRGDSERSDVFRKYSTEINSAFSMASMTCQRVKPPGGGWSPTVVIQGRVSIMVGAIKAAEGKPPAFAQLYVMDPEFEDHEDEIRFEGIITRCSKLLRKEKPVLKELIYDVNRELKAVNPFIQDWMTAADLIEQYDSPTLRIYIDPNKRPSGEHARKYNKNLKEIAVAMEDSDEVGENCFILKKRGWGYETRQIADWNRAADPLRFVLLFPTGINGWSYNDWKKTARGCEKCSMREYYRYHLQLRPFIWEERIEPRNTARRRESASNKNKIPNVQLIHRARRLFQEYVCMVNAKFTAYELNWQRQNQHTMRAEKYAKLTKDGDKGGAKSRGKVILGASFTGSPRYYIAHYQDSMAVVREKGKPDFFVTMTCNPSWPEILEALNPGEQPHDRPDIVCRVFRLKMKEFYRDLTKNESSKGVRKGFGNCIGHVWCVEHQKRGLPHTHGLLIMGHGDKPTRPEHVDQCVCAELPPNPLDLEEGPAREIARKQLDAVLRHHVHVCNPICLRTNGLCRHGFPKDFRETTEFNETDSYPLYRRRNQYSVEHNGRKVTDAWIVPYNITLLLKFDCHINVECTASVSSVKYICKYIDKGGDRLMVGTDHDEVKSYQDLRSFGAIESVHRLFEFDITDLKPPVMKLRIHGENEQNCYFGEEASIGELIQRGPPKTELTAFFDFNRENPEAEKLPYGRFPTKYTYDKTKKQWHLRKRGETIGRIDFVHPTQGENYYLRLLLLHPHSAGKTSHRDIRTLDGRVMETYKAVCEALQILENDGEWEFALSEAAITQASSQIRDLFNTILQFCEPANPRMLFDKHHAEWLDDYKWKFKEATDDEVVAMLLLDLESKFELREKGLNDYNLPPVSEDLRKRVAELRSEKELERQPMAIQEQLDFELEVISERLRLRKVTLNERQLQIFRKVTEAIDQVMKTCFFIDARGGTGKTFLLNTILDYARSLNGEKRIAIAVASSGIAATLLSLGKTFHSCFKVPIQHGRVDPFITFNIAKDSVHAKIIREATLIVWDEAPMSHRYLLEGLDRTLRDVMNSKEPFGGKIVLLAGDFRQVLPVIRRGSRAQTTRAAINRSPLWQFFDMNTLVENVRIGKDPARSEFRELLQKVGEGKVPKEVDPDYIRIPEEFLFEIDDRCESTINDSLDKFIDLVFPNLKDRLSGDPEEFSAWIAERAILTPRNDAADCINDRFLRRYPGSEVECCSADSTMMEDDAVGFSVEFLNEQNPSGMPPHCLNLKAGFVLILLRNLNPKKGLCNGTRLIVVHASNVLLECTIAGGDFAGEMVLIPRLNLIANEGELPMRWRRRQFPVKVAFAMTINKAQGQTLRTVGIWLRDPVFSHGQFYVGISRVGDPKELHVAICRSDGGLTRNVVYAEALSSYDDANGSKVYISRTEQRNPVKRRPDMNPPDDDVPALKSVFIQDEDVMSVEPFEDESDQIMSTVLHSRNVCDLTCAELSELWNEDLEQLQIRLQLFRDSNKAQEPQNRFFSCGPDAFLDLLFFGVLPHLTEDVIPSKCTTAINSEI